MKKFLFAALSVLTASLSLAAVNINTASPSELEALPGIGPAKAKAIVDYRQQHGAFKSVEELKNVKGIGEGIFSKLKAEAQPSRPHLQTQKLKTPSHHLKNKPIRVFVKLQMNTMAKLKNVQSRKGAGVFVC